MDLFLFAGKTYTLSLPGTYADRLSFYLESPTESSLDIEGIGSFQIQAGFNEIPLHMELSSLSLQFASAGQMNAVLKAFKVIGRTSTLSVNAPNDLFSAVYPAGNSLFTAWLMPSPTSPTNSITLLGLPKCKARVLYNPASDIKKQTLPTMEYAQIENFPLPKMIASCQLAYTGSCSLNGVSLPVSNQGVAAYSFPNNTVQIGSQEVEANIPWGGGATIECDGLVSFTLTLAGDSKPYILYSPGGSIFYAGYSPEDFANLTFLPATQWRYVYGEISLPSSFYGGVFKIEFTDLPSGISASQEELAFQIFDMKEEPVRSISKAPKNTKSELSGIGSPIVLTSSPTQKPTDPAPSYNSKTPFFSNSGAGIVYPGGNAFTGASLSPLSASFLSMPANTDDALSNAYQGFTGKVALSRMGYSITAENVQCESDNFPIEGDTVYVDPSLLNGKTIEFAYPFKSVQLAPGQSEIAGYLSTFPIPLDTSFQPENVYAITPRLDAFWSDENVEWASANKAWGMDNPNLKYHYTPDIKQPYMTLHSAANSTVSLGVHASNHAPVGCQIAYQIPAKSDSAASLIFAGGDLIPLIADGSMHTLDIAPSLQSQSTVDLSIQLQGEIRIYKAEFTEGNWSLYATTGEGYRISLNPLLCGEVVNLCYWTHSLTFDLINYGATPSLPGGFELQANLNPEIDLAEEAAYEPYYFIFFSNTSPNGTGFFQVQAQGIDEATGELVDMSPDLIRFELSSSSTGAFSYFGGGWFYCSQIGASATVAAWYGGQNYTLYLG